MKKKFFYVLLICSVFILILTWGANFLIVSGTKKCIYGDVDSIPVNKVGLLLGTNKYLGNGSPNPFFSYRIKAAVELYKSGKIKNIVVSGDNSVEHYNEPQQMKEDLVREGVPADVIYLDYAGFRTLDSVVRMKKIFGQNCFTVISQKFHNERAIYIGKHYGYSIVGYNAKDVSSKMAIKVAIREKLARVKVFVDFLLGKKPKFLGNKVYIS